MPLLKRQVRERVPFKKDRKIIYGTSGDAVVLGKHGVTKFFVNDNRVYPKQYGRHPGKPITNHAAINYYYIFFKERRPRTRDERIMGAGSPKTFTVRPIKLIREGKGYHIVEHINGPNLFDLISVAGGAKISKQNRGGRIENPEEAADYKRRRDLMAEFIRKNKKEFSEFKKTVHEMKAELYDQINWTRGDGDLYNSNIKESDFVVEGFERGNDGKIKAKLVMVDFQ